MLHALKRATCIKKLEKHVSSLKKNCIASLSADDNELELDISCFHIANFK